MKKILFNRISLVTAAHSASPCTPSPIVLIDWKRKEISSLYVTQANMYSKSHL